MRDARGGRAVSRTVELSALLLVAPVLLLKLAAISRHSPTPITHFHMPHLALAALEAHLGIERDDSMLVPRVKPVDRHRARDGAKPEQHENRRAAPPHAATL